ncbi:MAG TPA: winged helix-turn-helix domain-containing protein [Acetobacteraceae bacterium]|nr:winged helix-turn-helix domain-containing protein [Acetobacteraceae bacterium]
MSPETIRPVYASGDCEIDLARRQLRVLGSPVAVGARAFEIVEILAESAGELVTKDELMNRIWPGAVVMDNTLQVHAAAVRKALGPYRSLLKTESRRGYRLVGRWSIRRQDAARQPSGLQRIRAVGEQPRSNFPAAVTRLIGRATAAQRLRDLVSAYRVVTLTGPGGIGKTTLGLKVARRVLGEFADGGWLVELASLSDPDLVPTAVASVLGLRLSGEMISAGAVARAIGEMNLLLILDNCEHVIDAVANLVEAIVPTCPRITILATSREILRTHGEYVYRVPPLEVPALGEEVPDQILGHSAVDLFIARATALGSNLSLQGETLGAIGGICRRLDGIPLAIEFAAARAAMLGVQQVAAGLHHRFALLTSGRRTALPRHQTLRATLDWSHALLPEAERRLLRRLAVFPAGFTLDAAAAIMADTALAPAAVTDGVANLVTKSLIMPDKSDSNARWYLLEIIRAYAWEKLAESGEQVATARRHAEYFRDLVVPNPTEPVPPLTMEDVHRHESELDNIRAALDWSFSPEGDAAIGVVLVAAFALVWFHLSLLGECRTRAEQALGMLGPDLQLTQDLECRLLTGLGLALTFSHGSTEHTRTIIARARALAIETNNIDAQLRTLLAQWSMASFMGENGASLATAREFAELARHLNDDALILAGDRFLGIPLLRLGNLASAKHCLTRMVDRYVAPPSGYHTILFYSGQRVQARANLAVLLALQGYLDQARRQIALCLDEAHADETIAFLVVLNYGVAPIHWMTGDFAAAETAVATMDELASRLDARLWKTFATRWRGKLRVARGDFASGSALLRDSLDECERNGWRVSNAEFLGDLACGLAGLGRFDEAFATLEQALVQADGSRDYWRRPELLRIKGALLMQQGPGNETLAEDCFRSAGELARTQDALFWELRAALSMARLRVSLRDQAGAAQVLQPVYARFSEGFDSADLVAAKHLLEATPVP